MTAGTVLGAAVAAVRGRSGDAAVALCAIAVLAGSWIGVARAAPGGVEIAPAEVSLGTLPEGDIRVVRLTVSNRGPAAADVVVVPSCTCMTPEAGPIRLEPFSHRSVAVTVSSARRPGYNVAHVQITTPAGVAIGRTRIDFTAVRRFVFDPPVLFLRGGEDEVVTRAYCLAGSVPAELRAESDDPAVTVRVEQRGGRVWDVSACLGKGPPRRPLATIRVSATDRGRNETAGTLTVSLPRARIGDARISSAAEAVGPDRARAWILLDSEASCPIRVLALRARSGAVPEWKTSAGGAGAGSCSWIELTYPRTAASGVIELDVEAGKARERIQATLPADPA